MVSDNKLRSFEFRRQRERAWGRLEDLVRQADRHGTGLLDADELAELPILYRQAVSSLSVARSLTLDKNVLAYLESLAARAYLCVYSSKRNLADSLADFFRRRFPALVWSMRGALALAVLLLACGTVCGLAMTLSDPDMFFSFVDPALAGGRSPLSSAEELREALYEPETTMAPRLTAFASFLFSHNARIGLFCFALGLLAGIPVFLLLFMNGLGLGAFWAIYLQKGLAVDFWLWVLPHGVTELLAMCICGAAGLAVGYALVFPGHHTRMVNLALQGRRAAAVAAGCIALFFVAAIIEGFFRQLVTDQTVRLTAATATALFWTFYFVLLPRRLRPGGPR